ARRAWAPIAAAERWGHGWWTNQLLVMAWLLFSAALIVSRVPTLAMKSVSVPRRSAALLLIAVAIVVAGVVTYPYVVLLALVALYLVHIPFAVRSRRWVATRPETWEYKPAERRAIRRDERGSDAPHVHAGSGPGNGTARPVAHGPRVADSGYGPTARQSPRTAAPRRSTGIRRLRPRRR